MVMAKIMIEVTSKVTPNNKYKTTVTPTKITGSVGKKINHLLQALYNESVQYNIVNLIFVIIL